MRQADEDERDRTLEFKIREQGILLCKMSMLILLEDPWSEEWELLAAALNEMRWSPRYQEQVGAVMTIRNMVSHWSSDREGEGYSVTRCMRAVAESVLTSHFGEGIIEDVFRRYRWLIDD
ncbi:hypothetical protein CRG98_009620 [Punica granatum]|uniref:Uncharacterized protein n=1 Tax=Punica granatum TaxID=22663 RepID=A0A2I0KNE8_PUNGR|nr:hypothetical protein CRG98_009620 [Punica granatum]